MCGLAGVVLKQKERTQKELDQITSAFSRMLQEADTRGGHATGFAIVDKQGDYLICKRDKDASEFLEDIDVIDNLDLTYSDVTCLMGHTRYSTLGSPKINKNNHPIRTGNTIGTHNGSIHNHKELFSKYSMKRHAQVDSEAIFRLYETSKDVNDFADNRLPNVRGRVAIVWADLEYPEYVYAVKANNPLELVYIKELEIYAYGSTLEIIKAGFKNYTKRYNVDANRMLRINTKTFRIRVKKISIKKPKPISNSFYNSKIGAYETKSKSIYSHTVSRFVPRYSYSESRQQNLFKKYKAVDGSTIKKIIQGEK